MDGPPAQAGLKTTETPFLKQPMAVADRETLLRIVIAEKLRRVPAPRQRDWPSGPVNVVLKGQSCRGAEDGEVIS